MIVIYRGRKVRNKNSEVGYLEVSGSLTMGNELPTIAHQELPLSPQGRR